jgi:drug/metabolite transporter (DMT)-like permease
MNTNSNLFILIFLGILWSTFAICSKISAEALSPFFVAFSRLALGGVLLYSLCLIQRRKIFIAKNFKYYAIVGFFNSALPFTLFAMSATSLDSGIVAILDGTVPMFEVLISIFFLKRHVDKNSIWGIVLGIIGVVVTSMGSGTKLDITWSQAIAIIAILAATSSYAAASLYINAKCKHIESMTMASGSVIFAATILSPSLFFANFGAIDAKVATSLMGLGFLCTGIAYIFYFKLTAEESPRTVVSVVLLIPVFGTIFGAIFLGETITITKIIGCITILASMKFILNLSRQNFFKSKTAPIV